MDISKIEPIFDQLVMSIDINPHSAAMLLYIAGEIKKSKIEYAEKCRKAVEETPEHQAFKAAMDEVTNANTREFDMAEALRNITRDKYSFTAEKKFTGSFIRMVTKVIYDKTKAIEYGIEHKFTEILNINAREFEKLAKIAKPDFVTIVEEPQACIVSDLGKVFSELTEDDVLNMLVE